MGCRQASIAAIGVSLAAMCGCASQSGSVSPAASTARHSSPPMPSAPAAPAGSVAAILPTTSVGPFILDSGTLLIAGSDVPPAYEADITVTITAEPDESSSPNAGPATEYEVALVKISGHSGAFHYTDQDFKYLSAGGGLYPPVVGADAGRFGEALGSGTVGPGQTAQGDVVFHVPTGGGQVQFYYGYVGGPGTWRSTT